MSYVVASSLLLLALLANTQTAPMCPCCCAAYPLAALCPLPSVCPLSSALSADFYPSMTMFALPFKSWVAVTANGTLLNGTFRSDDSFTLQSAVRWVAVFDPTSLRGAVYQYPVGHAYQGRKGFENSFWNRAYDHKLYLLRPIYMEYLYVEFVCKCIYVYFTYILDGAGTCRSTSPRSLALRRGRSSGFLTPSLRLLRAASRRG